MQHKPFAGLRVGQCTVKSDREKGFALFVITVVVFLVGVVSMSNLRLTDLTETLAGNSILVDSPEYVTEEIGNYLADGGSGIVSLDRGSAGYGRSTLSGRELILYRLQSVGSGSVENSRAVVESLYVINR